MKRLLIIGLLFTSLASTADTNHEDLVHFSAHFGMSYAISMFTYGVMRKGLGISVNESLGFSIFTTLVVGLTYKYMEAMTTGSFAGMGTSMLYNATGVAASYITIKMFEF
jgi:EamA domain-containing membrane protein RarD